MSDDPFEKFKFKIKDPNLTDRVLEAIEPTVQKIAHGGDPNVVYSPYIPLQVTPTLLNPEPDVIEKLAAVVDPELKAKHEANAALNHERVEWMKDVMRRHGKKIKLVKPEFFKTVTITNL